MTLDYGNYGVFLIIGNAGFISSTVCQKDFAPAPSGDGPGQQRSVTERSS